MRCLVCLMTLALFGCTGEVDTTIGVLEPVRVVSGSFHPGSLAEAPTGTLAITSIESASGLVLAGERDRLLVGRTSADAFAVGLRFAELGTGWWTVPVQDLDPSYPGERDFQLRFDVGGSVPPGSHLLALAAIDEQGERGEVFELEVCVRDPLLPDNLNPCDPELLPPALVIALEWDVDVDLDLIVDTPSGKRISAKTPTSDSGEGTLLRDSNAACAIDGLAAEALVWAEPPSETGTYLIRADLFDACGESGALLRAVVLRRVQRDDGTWALRETERVDAAMFDIQASGGAGAPLYLMAVEVTGEDT
jgi:hypothetical protein